MCKPCPICHLPTDTRRSLELDISSGMKPAEAGRKYGAYITTRTRPDLAIIKHTSKCKQLDKDKFWELQKLQEQAARDKEIAKQVFVEPKPAPDTQIKAEVSELKHVKTAIERNEAVYELAMLGARTAIYRQDPDTEEWELLPNEQIDRKGLAACLAQVNAANAFLGKPEPTTMQQTTNINLSVLSDKELDLYEKIASKLEGSTEGEGKKTST